MNRAYAVVVAALACVLGLCAVQRAAAEPSRALELEGRLIAPCCWVQTLDVHESELASALRGEIRARFARGEAAQAIEDDLARRYSDRIRAVPRGHDPRSSIPLIVGSAMAIAAAVLVVLGLRWIRRRGGAVDEASETIDSAFDAALDAELLRDDAG